MDMILQQRLLININQAPVVQKIDNAIHQISLYSLDIAISFPNTYPMDSVLSCG